MKQFFSINGPAQLLNQDRAHWTIEQWGAWLKIRCYVWSQENHQGKCTYNDTDLKKIVGWEKKHGQKAWREVIRQFKIIGKWLTDPDSLKQLGLMGKKGEEQSVKAKLKWAYDELNQPGLSADAKKQVEKEISDLKARLTPGKKVRKSKIPAEKPAAAVIPAPEKPSTPSISASGKVYPDDFEQEFAGMRIYRKALKFWQDVITEKLAAARGSEPLKAGIDKKALISYAENVLSQINAALDNPTEFKGGKKLPKQMLFERKMYYPNKLAPKFKLFGAWECLEKLQAFAILGGNNNKSHNVWSIQPEGEKGQGSLELKPEKPDDYGKIHAITPHSVQFSKPVRELGLREVHFQLEHYRDKKFRDRYFIGKKLRPEISERISELKAQEARINDRKRQLEEAAK